MGLRMWILYDGRACAAQGTDDAVCLVTCDTDAEARGYAGDYGQMACYSYDKNLATRELVNEQWEWDWWPGDGFTDREKPKKRRRRRKKGGR